MTHPDDAAARPSNTTKIPKRYRYQRLIIAGQEPPLLESRVRSLHPSSKVTEVMAETEIFGNETRRIVCYDPPFVFDANLENYSEDLEPTGIYDTRVNFGNMSKVSKQPSLIRGFKLISAIAILKKCVHYAFELLK